MPINFRSKLHKALLNYYFSNPEDGHYIRELSRNLSFSVSLLSRELNKFTRLGIFVSSKRGKEKHFFLNKHHPLYNEFRKITKYIARKK